MISPWIFGLFVLALFAAGGALILLDDGGASGGSGGAVIGEFDEPDEGPPPEIQLPNASGADRERLTANVRPPSTSTEVVAAVDPDTPTGQIQGLVVDERDVPVAAAELRVYEGSPITNLPLARQLLPPRTTSDADGRFVLEGVPVGKNYVVVGEHDDFATSEIPGIRVLPDGPAADVRLVMRQGAVVSGLVTTLGENPIPGATVELYDTVADAQRKPAERLPWKVMLTDATGRFAFEHISTASLKVRVQAPGYESQSQMLNAALQAGPKDEHLTFRLDEGDVLAGICVDALTDRPVPGARLEATTIKRNYQGNAVAFSVEDGTFLLEGLSLEYDYQLRAEAEGYSVASKTVRVTDGRVVVELNPRSQVEGWVVDGNGQPVTVFDVVLMRARPGAEPSLMGDLRHFSNAEGHFVFDNLEPGHYAFEARAEGFAASRSEAVQLQRNAGTAPSVQITMRRGGTLKGLVVDSKGEPVVRALVEVNLNNFVDTPILKIFETLAPSADVRYRVRTNDKGRFQIKSVPEGIYQISVKHPEHAPYVENDVDVRDDDNGGNAEYHLIMPASASVAGRALDENRRPLAYTQIQIHQTNGFSDSVTTDADGFWRFDNLRPGTYNLQINPEQLRGEDVAPLMRLVYATRSKREITLYEGQELTGIEIYLSEQ